MKPFINRIYFHLNFRLVIAGLVFLLMIFATYLTGDGFSVWNIFPRILPSYNWLLWIVIFSFSVAYIDVVFYITIFVLLEYLIILAVSYIISLSGLLSFNSVFIFFITSFREPCSFGGRPILFPRYNLPYHLL